MKHFISQNGTIYGIDKDQDFLIQDDWVELSDEELAERLKPTPVIYIRLFPKRVIVD